MPKPLTEADIKLHTFYGEKGRMRVAAYTWLDGDHGVNYVVDGLDTMDALLTDKAGFLAMANGELQRIIDGPLSENPVGNLRFGNTSTENLPEEARNFLDQVLAMPEKD
jgi:hypothetical protein